MMHRWFRMPAVPSIKSLSQVFIKPKNHIRSIMLLQVAKALREIVN
jgi:hypothetical protein